MHPVTRTLYKSIGFCIICDECKGITENKKCKKCYNKGIYFNEKEIELNIPPKTKNNDIIIIRGKGNKLKPNE